MSESGACSLIYVYIHPVANNAMLQLGLLHDFHNIVLITKHKLYTASGSVLLPNVKNSRRAPSLATATESSSNHAQEFRMTSVLLLALFKYHSNKNSIFFEEILT